MFFSMYPKVLYDVNNTGVKRLLTNLATYSSIEANQKLLDDVTFYKKYTIPDGARPDQVSQELYGRPDYYWTFFIINRHLKNYYSDWPKTTNNLREYVVDKFPYLAGITRAWDGVASNGNEDFSGKGIIGEVLYGQVTGARATLIRKYPTQGYIALEPVSDQLRLSGEAMIGETSGDTFTVDGFVPEADAPAYHIDTISGERAVMRTAGGATTPVSYYEIEREKNIEASFIRVIRPEYIVDVAREFKRSMQEEQ